MNTSKMTLFIGLILTAALITLLGSWSCSSKGYTGQVQSMTVAWSPFEQEALLWIAEDQNLFKRNGLNVSLREYDTGAGSLSGMINGEADITLGVTEFPIVRRAFEKSRVSIVAIVAKIEQQYLVGGKDRGIDKPADLKGKRIGTTLGTIAEFYLGRLLELNGVNIRDVTVVDLKTPAEWENAVPDGTVDAIVTAQPYADLAAKRLGTNAVVWPAQGEQNTFGLVVSTNDWVAKNPEPLQRFVKSLAQAEEYARNHPPEAKAIIRKWLNADAELVDSIWSKDQFSMSLDQSLIVAMEDEARWMIKNNLTNEKEVPFFNGYIYEGALKAVKPEAVNIIR